MAKGSEPRTDQEDFWAGEFGNHYIARNRSSELLASNVHLFSDALRTAGKVESCIELGANIGMNLAALQILFPSIELRGVEINAAAAAQLANRIGADKVDNVSIFDWHTDACADLAMIKGVLIHLNPDRLIEAYDKLHSAASKFILIAEYYNPVPVSISYRGHENRLFKRDFAGEMLDRFSDLRLRDYGFVYHRDEAFPQDDVNWFLLEKHSKREEKAPRT